MREITTSNSALSKGWICASACRNSTLSRPSAAAISRARAIICDDRSTPERGAVGGDPCDVAGGLSGAAADVEDAVAFANGRRGEERAVTVREGLVEASGLGGPEGAFVAVPRSDLPGVGRVGDDVVLAVHQASRAVPRHAAPRGSTNPPVRTSASVRAFGVLIRSTRPSATTPGSARCASRAATSASPRRVTGHASKTSRLRSPSTAPSAIAACRPSPSASARRAKATSAKVAVSVLTWCPRWSRPSRQAGRGLRRADRRSPRGTRAVFAAVDVSQTSPNRSPNSLTSRKYGLAASSRPSDISSNADRQRSERHERLVSLAEALQRIRGRGQGPFEIIDDRQRPRDRQLQLARERRVVHR